MNFPDFGLKITAAEKALMYTDAQFFFSKPVNFHHLGKVSTSGDEKLDDWMNKSLAQSWLGLGVWADGMLGAWRLLRNFEQIAEAPCFSDYVPVVRRAVLVCGGPSVELYWDFLKKLEGKEIAIMACDTVVTEMLKRGIKPDLCFSSERVPEKTDVVIPNRNEKWCLSAVSFAEDMIKDSMVAIRKSDTFCQAYPQDKRRISDWIGLSVAPLALGVLFEMGYQEVWLIGQDLCFDPKTGESHVKTQLTHPDYGNLESGWEPARLREATNWKGETVKTTYDWVGFQRNLTVIMTYIGKDRTLYNLSPFGLPIRNEKRAEPEDLLKCLSDYAGPKLRRLKIKRREDASGRKNEILAALQSKSPFLNTHVKKLFYETLLRPMADYEHDKGKWPDHTALFNKYWANTVRATTEIMNQLVGLKEFPDLDLSRVVGTEMSYCHQGSAMPAFEAKSGVL